MVGETVDSILVKEGRIEITFLFQGRNKTRDQRPEPGTKIRDQILSAEYGY